MKTLIALGALFLCLGDDRSASEADKKEYALFEGTWTFESVKMNGQPMPMENFAETRVILKGNTFTVVHGNQKSSGTYRVDTTTKPKQLDAIFTEGPEKGQS
jgi:uncharacterized protein (TIGR03067 family)